MSSPCELSVESDSHKVFARAVAVGVSGTGAGVGLEVHPVHALSPLALHQVGLSVHRVNAGEEGFRSVKDRRLHGFPPFGPRRGGRLR